jgi:pimeloyl-ACP methyl ester carboxylesterase
MDQDIDEIHGWIQWLQDKGHRDIVLMGHSTGAMQIIHYARRYPEQAIQKLIAISLVPLGRKDQPGLENAIDKASQLIDTGDTRIHKFTLAYCNENYAAPAQDFLSYALWNSKKLLGAVETIKYDISVIMGGKDDSAYKGWIKDMQQTGADVRVIDGANHFFNTGYEFELNDKLLHLMEHRGTRKRP